MTRNDSDSTDDKQADLPEKLFIHTKMAQCMAGSRWDDEESEYILASVVEKRVNEALIRGVREAGYQIMRSMENQPEALKASSICKFMADSMEAARSQP